MIRSTCLLLLACTLSAQTPPRPEFDVASIKPVATPGPGAFRPNRGGPGTADPTRIAWTSTLTYLVQQAYGMQLDQVLGTDGKMFYPTEAFELNATMHPGTTQEEFRMMLQNLLAERFHLVHHQAKPFPGYELTVANGGSKLKESTPVEPVPPSDKPVAVVNGGTPDEKGFPQLRPGAKAGTITPGLGKWGMYRGRYRQSMAEFVVLLPGFINGSNGEQMGADTPRVFDRTGLTGTYEFTLEFAGGIMIPQSSLLGQLRRAQGSDAAPATEPVGSGGGPTLFNALEKQLGLQLKKTKDVPVDMLVVDHADKMPTGN